MTTRPAHRAPTAACVAIVLVLSACSGTPKPRAAQVAKSEPASPLGNSYVLVPLPGESESLLGRILTAPPQPGQALDQVAQPNPCGELLVGPKTSPTSSSFEDAEELGVGVKAHATLGIFGFQGDVQHATHFLYKVTTERMVEQVDTADYGTCCAQKDCGYGYVSALVYGSGEYATAEETAASGGVDVIGIAGTSGELNLKVLHRRKVHGWFAALIRPRDPSKAGSTSALGGLEKVGVVEATDSEQVKALYEPNKLGVTSAGASWRFEDPHGPLTENEFVRRYRSITGSNDLDDIEGTRSSAPAILPVGLVMLGAGLGLVALGFAVPRKTACNAAGESCEQQITPAHIGFWAGGGTVAVLGLGFLIAGLASYGDGTADQHHLTEYDGRLYANRYNRALLRRAIKDVSEKETGARPFRPLFGAVPLPTGGGAMSLSFVF